MTLIPEQETARTRFTGESKHQHSSLSRITDDDNNDDDDVQRFHVHLEADYRS